MKMIFTLLIAASALCRPLSADERIMYINTADGTQSFPVAVADSITFGTWTPGDTLEDYRDHRTYPTILFEYQYSEDTACWMGANLHIGTRMSSYCYGTWTPGPVATDNGIIERYYLNNDPVFDSVGLALYTWDEAMDYATHEGARGICPAGWHIPSEAEWNTLLDEYGYSAEEFFPGGATGMNIDSTQYDTTASCLDCETCGNGNTLVYWTSTRLNELNIRVVAFDDGEGLGLRITQYAPMLGACLRCVRD